ncbi:hypothetical protein, partial [Micromonospora parva]|uniref:hypothetical protein n=1 Tax=Micromonospora parva TaxID=1464048 RepID=UPI0036697435
PALVVLGRLLGEVHVQRRLTFFTRVLTGTDPAPTTRIPSGSTGSLIAGRITVLSRSAGTGWRWSASMGEDVSSDTTFFAAAGTALPWAAGDFVVLGYALQSASAVSVSAEGVTASGITFGTVTEQAEDGFSVGNLARYAVATGDVTAGSGTQVPTITATLSAGRTGSAGVLRIREASSAIAVSAQSVFPPRNLVSLTGLTAENIVSATIQRQVGTDRTGVRAATAVDVTGDNVLLRVDGEQPFGVPVNYVATLTDSTGGQWELVSSSVTSTVAADVISDAVRGIGAAVTIQAWPNKRRTRDATVFNVGGRLVAVGKPRSGAAASVTVRTLTDEAGDALQEVLDAATNGVILIRKQATMPGVDGYLAVTADDEDRMWHNPVRFWQLETVEAESWPDVLEAAGFTLQDIADNFETLQDLADAFTPGTLLAIALFDFGA